MRQDCCIECGQPLTELPNGSRLRCCNGKGYWSDVKPLPKDQWYPVVQKKGRTAYVKPGWMTTAERCE